MKLVIVLCFTCFSFVAGTANSVNYEGYNVYEVIPRTLSQIKLLEPFQKNNNFDFWSRLTYTPNVPISIMISPVAQQGFLGFLQNHNIIYKLLIEDVQRSVARESLHQRISPKLADGEVNFKKYMRHTEINAYLNRLASAYPDIVTTEVIGQSYENRNLTVIKISSDSKPKPTIFVDAGIHAREWIAPPVALYIINQLVENSTNAALFKNVNWYILPSLNPDGYEYTFNTERFWRKTRSAGALCYGTDANRNCDFHWMEEGASDDQCSDVFAGKQAFSEKETQALRDFLTKNKNDIKLYLTFHSYGQYILYPWGYTSDLPDDWKELQSLGEDVNDAISKVAGTEYTIGSSTNVLYAAAGGTDDYAKGVVGIELSYTIELPGGGWDGFDPPATSILPVVTETWEGIKIYQKYIENKFA